MYRVFILPVIALTVLASCTSGSVGTSPEPQNESSHPEQTREASNKVQKIALEIENSNQYQGCIENQKQYCANRAGNEIAREKGDIQFCKHLSDAAQIENCEFGLLFSKAMKQKQSSICKDLTNMSQQESCVLAVEERIAMENQDLSACEKVGEALIEYQKIDMKSATGSALVKSRVESCKLFIIQSSDDFSKKDCDQLTDEFAKQECVDFASALPKKENS